MKCYSEMHHHTILISEIEYAGKAISNENYFIDRNGWECCALNWIQRTDVKNQDEINKNVLTNETKSFEAITWN